MWKQRAHKVFLAGSEKVNRDHEDKCVDGRCRDRGLTTHKDTTGTGWERQKNTRAQYKEENCDQEVEHLYY